MPVRIDAFDRTSELRSTISSHDIVAFRSADFGACPMHNCGHVTMNKIMKVPELFFVTTGVLKAGISSALFNSFEAPASR